MSDETNSKLISDLYSKTDEDDVTQTIEDMEEVGNPVFLHPLLDGYRKYSTSSFGHYFIAALGLIKSPETKSCLDEILLLAERDNRDHVPWVLDVLTQHKHFPSRASDLATAIIRGYLGERKTRLSLSDFELKYTLDYLKESGQLKTLNDLLRNILLFGEIDRQERAHFLAHLLRADPAAEFDWLIENKKAIIENAEFELAVGKELINWEKGKRSAQLKEIIISEGKGRGRELLIADIHKKKEQKKVQESKANEEERVVYGNSALLEQIGELRTQINLQIGAELFAGNDLLLKQIKVATDESGLIKAGIELR